MTWFVEIVKFDLLMYIETIYPNHLNFAAMNPNFFFRDLKKLQES